MSNCFSRPAEISNASLRAYGRFVRVIIDGEARQSEFAEEAQPAVFYQQIQLDQAGQLLREVSRCYWAGPVIRKSPRTSASICVRSKQSMASSGLQTIGSLSLNEVFSTTGTPVSSANAEINAW